MAKMWKPLFEILRMSCIIDQPIFVYWLFFTHSSPNFIKSENESGNQEYPSFQWG